jgi:hypothetical protein
MQANPIRKVMRIVPRKIISTPMINDELVDMLGNGSKKRLCSLRIRS